MIKKLLLVAFSFSSCLTLFFGVFAANSSIIKTNQGNIIFKPFPPETIIEAPSILPVEDSSIKVNGKTGYDFDIVYPGHEDDPDYKYTANIILSTNGSATIKNVTDAVSNGVLAFPDSFIVNGEEYFIQYLKKNALNNLDKVETIIFPRYLYDIGQNQFSDSYNTTLKNLIFLCDELPTISKSSSLPNPNNYVGYSMFVPNNAYLDLYYDYEDNIYYQKKWNVLKPLINREGFLGLNNETYGALKNLVDDKLIDIKYFK